MKKAVTTISIILVSTILTALVFDSVGLAQSIREDIQGGVDSAAGGTGGNPETTLQRTVTGVVNILTFLVGALSVLMILYGGYLYTTSAGDAGKIATAKRAFIYAVVGIAIAAMAQMISRFLIRYF